tara:strand:+ start:81 stop:272 length:192 start_codon:yes stop_codon:yes gene_type:complete
MSKKQKLRKKKQRERLARRKVLDRRSNLREERRLQKEVERIQWDARERITPIRNNKNDEPEEH